MSSEGRAKRGIAGAKNAENIPYRGIGGSHEHPLLTGLCQLARTMRASDYKDTSTYAVGVLGGMLADRLGYPCPMTQAIFKAA